MGDTNYVQVLAVGSTVQLNMKTVKQKRVISTKTADLQPKCQKTSDPVTLHMKAGSVDKQASYDETEVPQPFGNFQQELSNLEDEIENSFSRTYTLTIGNEQTRSVETGFSIGVETSSSFENSIEATVGVASASASVGMGISINSQFSFTAGYSTTSKSDTSESLTVNAKVPKGKKVRLNQDLKHSSRKAL